MLILLLVTGYITKSEYYYLQDGSGRRRISLWRLAKWLYNNKQPPGYLMK